LEDHRQILHPDYTIMFFICEDRNCGQRWAAAAKFGSKNVVIPRVINNNDARCPSCGSSLSILDSSGKHGCSINKVVMPGEPVLGQKQPG